jgi:hypothetical protein
LLPRGAADGDFEVRMVRIILLALVALFVTAGTLSYLLGVVLR